MLFIMHFLCIIFLFLNVLKIRTLIEEKRNNGAGREKKNEYINIPKSFKNFKTVKKCFLHIRTKRISPLFAYGLIIIVKNKRGKS